MFFRSYSFERAQLTQFGQLTWRSYAGMKKKAMEQEFTWSGFILSLSIAFFVVMGSSSALNVLYEDLAGRALHENRENVRILEVTPGKSASSLIVC